MKIMSASFVRRIRFSLFFAIAVLLVCVSTNIEAQRRGGGGGGGARRSGWWSTTCEPWSHAYERPQ